MFFYACSEGVQPEIIEYFGNEGRGIRKVYDEQGNLIEKQEIKRDPVVPKGYVIDGYYNVYNSGGLLKDSLNYREDKLNGLAISYFDGTSKVQHKAVFVDGRREGPDIQYYENGEVSQWRYYMEGFQSGLQSGRDSLGNWTWVIFSTRKDSIAFVAHLDKTGTVTNYSGIPIYLVERKHSVNAGQNFSIANLVAQFKRYRGQLCVTLKNENGSKIFKRTVDKFEVVDNFHCFFFDYRFERPGNYLYTVNYTLTDSTNRVDLHTWTVTDSITVW